MTPPRRTFRQRVLWHTPVRVRHYWKLLFVCATFIVLCAVVFSTVRVSPLVTSASDRGGDQVTQDILGTTDLFDATVAHRITLSFHDSSYQRMLDEYWDNGEKDFLEADITIDGTRITSVGIRLKGNSTLAGLTRNGKSRPGGFGPMHPGGMPPGAVPPGAVPPGAVPPGASPQGGAGPAGGFGRTGLKAEEPETLPWLIRFDEFVEGRRYQGHRGIAVRVAGMGGGSVVLNEALSLQMLATAGQITQRYAYTSFTVNDRPTTARLVVEYPDKNFTDQMSDSGVLYKSLATSRFTDQGDDPINYLDDFKQITKKGSQDVQPVVDLIRWVNTSSDAEFAAHLADHVDVSAFARYLAAQNLLLNADDMSGPGRNYYLWYDLTTKKFTVLGWDYNLAFGGKATQGPHDAVTMGLPPGFQPPAGMQLPAGVRPPGNNPQDGPAGFGKMGGNKLKERFLASAAFTKVYDDAYRDLYQKIYADAAALNALDSLDKVLATLDGYDPSGVAADVARLRAVIQQRTDYLATNAVITGG